MRSPVDKFAQAQEGLATIPFYPIAKWDARDSKDGEHKFRSVKLDLKTDPSKTNLVKFSEYFSVFDCGTPEQWCHW